MSEENKTQNDKPRFVGEKATLEGRIEYVRGVTYKAASDLHQELDESSYVLFRANNIQDGKLTFDDVQFVDRSKVKQKQLLRKGDILVCASSGSKGLVGKAALVSEDVTATFGAFCCVLRANGCDPRYLAHYFQSSQYRSAIETLCTGSNINNLKAGNFNSLFVPRYQEQDELLIVERLDEIQAQISLAKAQLSKLDQLVKSRFVEMFGSLEPNYATSEVCDVFSGYAFKSSKYVEEGIRIIRIANVQKGYIEDKMPCFYSGSDKNAAEAFALKKNDLLVSLTGNVGRVGIMTEDLLPAALNQRLACLRPKSGGLLDINYLFALLNQDKFEHAAISASSGSAQKNLSINWLKAFRIAVPSYKDQCAFAAFVQQVDKPRFAILQQIEKLETLKASLMQEYFG